MRRSPVSGQAADPPSSAVVGFGGAAPAHHRDRGEARVGMASATALVYGGIEPSLRHPSRTIHQSRRSSHHLQQKSTLDQPCPVRRRLPRDVRVKAPRCDRKQAGRTVGPGPSVPHRAATIHANSAGPYGPAGLLSPWTVRPLDVRNTLGAALSSARTALTRMFFDARTSHQVRCARGEARRSLPRPWSLASSPVGLHGGNERFVMLLCELLVGRADSA